MLYVGGGSGVGSTVALNLGVLIYKYATILIQMSATGRVTEQRDGVIGVVQIRYQ